MSDLNSGVVGFIKTDSKLLESVQFLNDFTPQEGVDYGWLLEYAQKQCAETMGIYSALDNKATSIITHLGSGLGVFSLAVSVATSTGAISGWVALSALIPFLIASASLLLAARSRVGEDIPWLPTIREMTRYAEENDKAKIDQLGYLDLNNEVLVRYSARRSALINESLWYLAVAAASLIVPLGTAVILRFVLV